MAKKDFDTKQFLKDIDELTERYMKQVRQPFPGPSPSPIVQKLLGRIRQGINKPGVNKWE